MGCCGYHRTCDPCCKRTGCYGNPMGKACWIRVAPKECLGRNNCVVRKIISRLSLLEAHRVIPFNPAGPTFHCK